MKFIKTSTPYVRFYIKLRLVRYIGFYDDVGFMHRAYKVETISHTELPKVVYEYQKNFQHK